MTVRGTEGVLVLLGDGASEDDLELARRIVLGAGLAEVRTEAVDSTEHFAPPDLFWMMIVASLPTFLNGAAKEAGTDAYKVLRSVVKQVWANARRLPRPLQSLSWKDHSGTEIILDPDLPDSAFRELEDELPNLERNARASGAYVVIKYLSDRWVVVGTEELQQTHDTIEPHGA